VFFPLFRSNSATFDGILSLAAIWSPKKYESKMINILDGASGVDFRVDAISPKPEMLREEVTARIEEPEIRSNRWMV
jgi:hypothetical protein